MGKATGAHYKLSLKQGFLNFPISRTSAVVVVVAAAVGYDSYGFVNGVPRKRVATLLIMVMDLDGDCI